MNVRALTIVSIATMAAIGCDRIPFIGGGSETAADSTAPDTTTAAMAPDTTTPPAQAQPAAQTPAAQQPAPVTTPPTPRQAPAPRPVQAPASQAGEVPWTPTHTGTIDPGMSSAQVIATWGEPVARRMAGTFTFLYFRNGCERRCGTFDLVLLDGDQVVDAVVRGFGHTYSGVSSSPANVQPVANPRPDTTETIG